MQSVVTFTTTESAEVENGQNLQPDERNVKYNYNPLPLALLLCVLKNHIIIIIATGNHAI